MTSRDPNRLRRGLALAAALALLASVAARPAAAETGATVTVTGAVVNELSLKLCDTSANFGTNLNSTGVASNSGDSVGVVGPSSDVDEGSFYVWTPGCQVVGKGTFVAVSSTATWQLTPCATENGGPEASPTLKIANGDLRWYVDDIGLSSPFGSYADANANTLGFALCDQASGTGSLVEPRGRYDLPGYLFLQVDPSDAPGTFATTTTWTLTLF
jgi:hypothetical protein